MKNKASLHIEKKNNETISLLKKGDMTAFDVIYNSYSKKLHQFVIKYLKNQEDAEGIVQEVFIKIWDSREKINIHASFESFLFTIAYNATISLLRKRLSEAKSMEYLKSLQKIESNAEIIDELQYKELNQKIQSLLNNLTPRQKEIYLLSREEGLTHEEISKKLNISESTVNNQLVTALKYLRNQLQDRDIALNFLFICLFLS